MLSERQKERTRANLAGVNPRLAAVFALAATKSAVPFIVTEGLRTHARQQALVRAGASRTMKSKHLNGRAADVAAVVDGQVRWDWPLYAQIAKAMKAAAKELKTPIVWGGDWKSFRDGPHFELEEEKHGVQA